MQTYERNPEFAHSKMSAWRRYAIFAVMTLLSCSSIAAETLDRIEYASGVGLCAVVPKHFFERRDVYRLHQMSVKTCLCGERTVFLPAVSGDRHQMKKVSGFQLTNGARHG